MRGRLLTITLVVTAMTACAPSPEAGAPASSDGTISSTVAPTTTGVATTLTTTVATAAPTAAPTTTVPTPPLPGCPATGRAAVADKAAQRFWLCQDGISITASLPMTTASAGYGLPPVGTYDVFAKDEVAWGIDGQRLERFVAFYTTDKGNRIAFHQYVDQDPATLGDLDQRGQSSGCFRVTTEDSWAIWDFLQIGDQVVILTN